MNSGFIMKCRCACFDNSHCAGTKMMSGTWKLHISPVQYLHPHGLHREFYQVLDIKKKDLFSEDNLKLVKYRMRL